MRWGEQQRREGDVGESGRVGKSGALERMERQRAEKDTDERRETNR